MAGLTGQIAVLNVNCIMRKGIILYIFLTLLVIFQACLYMLEGISFLGYWSDKIPVWLWLIATPIVIIKNIRKTAAKIYLGCLCGALVLSLIPFFIPAMLFFTFITASDRHFVVNVNDTVRIQKVFGSPMEGYRNQLTIKNCCFEKMAGDISKEFPVGGKVYRIEDVTRASIEKKSSDSALLILDFPGGIFAERVYY
jgi:hypothetical protein